MSRKSKPPEVISVTDQEAKELKKGIEESNLSPTPEKDPLSHFEYLFMVIGLVLCQEAKHQ